MQLTKIGAEDGISGFLQSLNLNLVESIISEFEDALKLHNRSSSRAMSESMLQDASSMCSSIMQTVHKNLYSLETAMAVDSLWKKVDIVYDIQNLSKIITNTSRALVMLTTWTMFDWVTGIVNHAISNPEPPSWVTCLIADIRIAIQVHHHETLKSVKAWACLHQVYLSNIPRLSDYNFTIPRLTFSPEKMNLVIGRIAINAIQFWLHFPSSEENTVKSSLIASLMESQTLAILYLEPVWKMYQNPYITVINGPNSHQRRSKPHTKTTIEAFHHQFCGHDLNDPDSELGKRLGYLNKLISVWSVEGQKQGSISVSDSLVC